MFKNMTIGKKLAFGFAVVLLVLTCIATMSFTGVGEIVNDAEEVIYGNELDAVMTQKEVDHLNWASQVNALLTDKNITELNVQTDDHECGFGKWLFSEQRKEAEKRIPELADLLKKIEEPHKHLHDSAIEIDNEFQPTHGDLATQLASRLSDHLKWINTVSGTLSGELGGLASYQNSTKNAVDQTITVLQGIDQNTSLGDTSARQKIAKATLRSLRYGQNKNDYMFIIDSDCKCILHPFNPELEGKDLSATKDTNGKTLFSEMKNIAVNNQNGFVTYYWQLPNSNQIAPKLSYVQIYKPWNWIVGTGVFLDHTDTHLVARVKDFAANKPFKISVQTDPDLCAFGKFLNDPETLALCKEIPELKTILDQCRQPHNQLHQSALTIEKHITELNTDQAVKVFEDESMTAMEKVGNLLEQAIALENKNIAATEKANHIYANKTTANLKIVQELLGKVRNTVKDNIMTQDTMLNAAKNTKRNVSISGIVGILAGIALAFFIARGITSVLKKIMEELSNGSEQVSAAASQVSASSQSLAEGASEQAAGLEETSSSLEEMATMTRQNSDNAQQANSLACDADTASQNGTESMSKMSDAINEIQRSSEETSKIIKVIDEIAFQTNLLALNAAVEAARAGEAGKGFAVVAEEVRNLAMRSAEAAKNTSAMIAESVSNASNGVEISNEVAMALEEITSSVQKVNSLISEISSASQEQTQGIDQVNTAMSQMDQVTQQNAANAEESASAAEELNAQAEQMNTVINQLAIIIGGANSTHPNSKTKSLTKSNQTFHQIASGSQTVGKKSQTAKATQTTTPLDDNDFSEF
ncbi:MAG: cache domain-containing protein [Phycisphaerae bacterium]|nr:cache domain-containing protein [Phycisphaerae bacterium]